jgi:hypothetical protein
MLRKDNFFFGFGLALLITAAGFGLLYLLNNVLLDALFGKPILGQSTIMIVALGLNIFFMNYAMKYNANRTGRGMLTFVFLCAAYIIYTYFGAELGIRTPTPEEQALPTEM